MKSLLPDVAIDKQINLWYTCKDHASEHNDLAETSVPFIGCMLSVVCCPVPPERPSETGIPAVQTKSARSGNRSPRVRSVTARLAAYVGKAVPAFQSVRITRPFA
jgi:hypothetical protein